MKKNAFIGVKLIKYIANPNCSGVESWKSYRKMVSMQIRKDNFVSNIP